METIPEWVRNNAVTDCKTVEEFLDKYYKPERFRGHGEKYAQELITSHELAVLAYRYTSISRHENVTGHTVTFIKATK